MPRAFSPPHNRKMTLILLAMCVLLAAAAAVAGINDNLPGILLAFLAATAFVLAFVHPWRAVKKYLALLLASGLGLVLFIILNIILDTAAQASSPGALQDVLQSTVVDTFSIIFIMVCAAALIVGAAGSAAMFIRNRA